MDNATQATLNTLAARITALEAQNAAFAREVRTGRVTVVDNAGQSRITLSCMDDGPSEVVVHHPTIDGAFAALVAGYDLEAPDAAPATVETCSGTGNAQWTEMNSQGGSLIHRPA